MLSEIQTLLRTHTPGSDLFTPEEFNDVSYELMHCYRPYSTFINIWNLVMGELTLVEFDTPNEHIYQNLRIDIAAQRIDGFDYEFLQDFLKGQVSIISAYGKNDEINRYCITVRAPKHRVEAIPCPYANVEYTALGGVLHLERQMYVNHPNLYDLDGERISGMAPYYDDDSRQRIVNLLRRRKLNLLLGKPAYLGDEDMIYFEQLILAC